MRIAVEMVDATGREAARAPDEAVDLLSLAEQQLREIGAVLTGDTGDERSAAHAAETGVGNIIWEG
jgi:hypothetical protein